MIRERYLTLPRLTLHPKASQMSAIEPVTENTVPLAMRFGQDSAGLCIKSCTASNKSLLFGEFPIDCGLFTTEWLKLERIMIPAGMPLRLSIVSDCNVPTSLVGVLKVWAIGGCYYDNGRIISYHDETPLPEDSLPND